MSKQYHVDKQQAQMLYMATFHKPINWERPTTYNEKIQVFKISEEAEKLWKYADKYEARKYVKKTVGEKYLTKLYGVYKRVEDINLATLPNQFVFKVTHGSGWNVICPAKSKLNWEEAKAFMSRKLKTNYYTSGQERQYKKATPRIICEEYLDPKEGLRDFKLFYFKGELACIEVVQDRFTNLKRFFYDREWKRMSVCSDDKTEVPERGEEIAKPSQLAELLEVADKLAKPFKHVRVDLYNFDGRILFGELTFTTANGTYKFNPPEFDTYLGNKFIL